MLLYPFKRAKISKLFSLTGKEKKPRSALSINTSHLYGLDYVTWTKLNISDSYDTHHHRSQAG